MSVYIINTHILNYVIYFYVKISCKYISACTRYCNFVVARVLTEMNMFMLRCPAYLATIRDVEKTEQTHRCQPFCCSRLIVNFSHNRIA